MSSEIVIKVEFGGHLGYYFTVYINNKRISSFRIKYMNFVNYFSLMNEANGGSSVYISEYDKVMEVLEHIKILDPNIFNQKIEELPEYKTYLRKKKIEALDL